jgi:curli biogenesis system outer membrane secretion channel CsgG
MKKATVVLFVLLGLQLAAVSQTPATAPAAVPSQSAADTEAIKQQLQKVKRIYIDSFGDDPVSKQAQAMLVTALTESKKFVVTENKDKADAILRGTALEKTSHEFHSLNDKAAAGSASGGHSGSIAGSVHDGSGWISGSSSGGFAAQSVATDDSKASTETIDDARLAVRLVSPDGDVLWASTQESKGAKFKGASADVADKIVKQLLRDIERMSTAPEKGK